MKTLFPLLVPVKNVAPVQERMHPLFEKASGLTESIIAVGHRGASGQIGLLINFHGMKLADGVHRLILPGANR